MDTTYLFLCSLTATIKSLTSLVPVLKIKLTSIFFGDLPPIELKLSMLTDLFGYQSFGLEVLK